MCLKFQITTVEHVKKTSDITTTAFKLAHARKAQAHRHKSATYQALTGSVPNRMPDSRGCEIQTTQRVKARRYTTQASFVQIQTKVTTRCHQPSMNKPWSHAKETLFEAWHKCSPRKERRASSVQVTKYQKTWPRAGRAELQHSHSSLFKNWLDESASRCTRATRKLPKQSLPQHGFKEARPSQTIADHSEAIAPRSPGQAGQSSNIAILPSSKIGWTKAPPGAQGPPESYQNRASHSMVSRKPGPARP